MPSSGGLIGALEPILKEHGVASGSAAPEPKIRPSFISNSKPPPASTNSPTRPSSSLKKRRPTTTRASPTKSSGRSFTISSRAASSIPLYWDFYQRVNQQIRRLPSSPSPVSATSSGSTTISSCRWAAPCAAIAPTRSSPSSSTSRFPRPTSSANSPGVARFSKVFSTTTSSACKPRAIEHNLVASIRTYLPDARINGRGDRRIVTTARGVTCIRDIPISIDFRDFSTAAAEPCISERVQQIRGQSPT